MKATFHRKASNVEELIRLGNAPSTDFIIEHIIELPASEYECFKNNLLVEYEFIEQFWEYQYIDSDEVWHCIAVMAEEKGGDAVVLNAEGYAYPRYSSYFTNADELRAYFKSTVLSEKCIEEILGIRSSSVCNMMHSTSVQLQALRLGYDELYNFIEYHLPLYFRFVLTGDIDKR